MFLETKELLVTETPTRVGKYHELAEALRRGALITKPSLISYGQHGIKGCAICAVARGMGIPDGLALQGWKTGLVGPSRKLLNDRFGQSIIHEIENRFMGYTKDAPGRLHSFAEIADWLDSL